jgi:hypothetical protein
VAGTVTVAETSIVNVHKVKWTWTSTAGGAADLVTPGIYGARVLALVTDPDGSAAPDDNYDVTVTDSEGYDVLQGAGANRDTANTETAVPTAESVAFGKLTLNVSNAGNAKSGVAILYLQGVKL